MVREGVGSEKRRAPVPVASASVCLGRPRERDGSVSVPAAESAGIEAVVRAHEGDE